MEKVASIYKKGNINDFYWIETEALGQGAFGVVKRAFDKKTNKPCAVKIY